MTSSTQSVYLSGVKSEFKSYIDELAQNLTRRGFIVKSRDDFRDSTNQLELIEEFIRNCDTVICLVGNQFGEQPSEEEAGTFSDISTNPHSFAQWEYLFGAHVGKSVHAFIATDDAPRDSRNDEAKQLAELQDLFSRTWVEAGIHGQPIEFDSLVSLRVEALVLKELTPQVVDPQIERKLNLNNPYPGFRKFTETDSHLFFGRDALVQKIITEIGTHPLTTIFGKTGSGKSSIIRAGVIPQFLQQFPGKAIVFTPNENPFESFANALARSGFPEEITELAERPSATVFQDTRKAAGNLNQPWLVFIDQFEELFTRPSKEAAPIVLQFIRALVNASSKSQSPMRIVLAVRDDFLGRVGDDIDLAASVDANLIRIPQPTWQELCQMIELPAAKHGVRYESELVSRIVSHSEGEGQSLPKLQYALNRLWAVEKADLSQFAEGVQVNDSNESMGGLHDRKINRTSYKNINGVPHALSSRLHELFGESSIAEKRQLRKILMSLILVAETDNGLTPMSRPAPRNLLESSGGIGSERYIDTLLNEGILTESERDDHSLELAHEVLIHEWKELEAWANDSRDAAEFKRLLHTDSRVWENKKQERNESFDDLWGGAKLERARELNQIDDEAGRSAFDRVGGLGDLENDFILASSDRFVKEMHYDLATSATEWKQNRKSKEKLWQGPQLNRATEMNQVQSGEQQSGFDRIGGLEKVEKKFIAASEKNNHPKSKLLPILLAISFLIAILAFVTPIDDMAINSILPDQSSIKEFFNKINGK